MVADHAVMGVSGSPAAVASGCAGLMAGKGGDRIGAGTAAEVAAGVGATGVGVDRGAGDLPQPAMSTSATGTNKMRRIVAYVRENRGG